MRKFFAVMATLLMVVVVAQFFLAAGGAFDDAPKEESFQAHRAVGSAFLLIAVLVTIAAALARMPGRVIGLSGLVAGLGILQFVIAEIAKAFGDTGSTSTAGELVFGLHAVNGLAIVAVTGMVVRQARQPSRTAEPARQAS